jgi:DNA-binding PadR family transcriptional regulator
MVQFENAPYLIVRSFLPYIALATLEKIGDASAYAIIKYIQGELGILISAGSMYTALYGLERRGYIEGKTKYRVTDKGLTLLQNVKGAMKEFLPKIEAFLQI